MTEFEKKADEIRQNAEQAKAEAQAAKAAAEAAQAEAKAAKDELASKTAVKTAQENIDNLDASVKEQAASIKELKKALENTKSVSFKADFRRALEAAKPEIEKALKSKADRFEVNLELKSVNSIGTGQISPNGFLGVAVDPAIYAATFMQISTEFEDWFEQLYNYCVNEGSRMIENKLDAEICAGAGADTNATTQKKIYGLVSQATAFSALASHAVAKANAADVIFDAMDQIAKAGFHANAAFVTWAIYRTIKSLKDENGNYLYDRVSGMLSGVRLFPTDRLSTGEILVADTNCAEVYAGNSYELEFIRNGAYDAYDVYFRKAAQTKVPTPNKKGLIYVASVATAIAALAPSS